MKRLSQSGSNSFCLALRKNALLINQSHFSNFALYMITIVNTYTEYACLKKDESTTTCKTARKHDKIKHDLIANVCKIFLQYGDRMRK